MADDLRVIGEKFPVQFVWQLPDGDYLRAIFNGEVIGLDKEWDRYVLRLERLMGGLQEDPAGTPRDQSDYTHQYWAKIGSILGSTIHLAYEADDGRPIRLRLTTLTGEHNYFSRRE